MSSVTPSTNLASARSQGNSSAVFLIVFCRCICVHRELCCSRLLQSDPRDTSWSPRWNLLHDLGLRVLSSSSDDRRIDVHFVLRHHFRVLELISPQLHRKPIAVHIPACIVVVQVFYFVACIWHRSFCVPFSFQEYSVANKILPPSRGCSWWMRMNQLIHVCGDMIDLPPLGPMILSFFELHLLNSLDDLVHLPMHEFHELVPWLTHVFHTHMRTLHGLTFSPPVESH